MLDLALILLAIALGVITLGLVSRRERDSGVDQRLERFASVASSDIEPDGSSQAPSPIARTLGKAVEGKGYSYNISSLMARANIRMTVGEFLVLQLAATVGAFLVGFVLGRGFSHPLIGILVGLVTAVFGWMGPQWYLSYRAQQRTKQFVNQLGDTVMLMANALRAGYSLLQTMEMVSRESPAPMSEEFGRIVREVGFGISPQEAMDHLLRRVQSEDLDLLVTAINIQHEVGGNLAQILEVIGETIRERIRIKGEVGVLTAQGKISGYVISALPIGLAGFLLVINPSYMGALFVFPWIILPIIGLLLIAAGFLVMRKIVQIEV